MGNLKSKNLYHRAIPANGKIPAKFLNMIFLNKVLPPAEDCSVSAR